MVAVLGWAAVAATAAAGALLPWAGAVIWEAPNTFGTGFGALVCFSPGVALPCSGATLCSWSLEGAAGKDFGFAWPCAGGAARSVGGSAGALAGGFGAGGGAGGGLGALAGLGRGLGAGADERLEDEERETEREDEKEEDLLPAMAGAATAAASRTQISASRGAGGLFLQDRIIEGWSSKAVGGAEDAVAPATTPSAEGIGARE